MGQVLIRNLEDDVLADYREAASLHGRSLEAELREALRRARPVTQKKRDALISRLRQIRAMTPAGARQTPGWRLMREDRDR